MFRRLIQNKEFNNASWLICGKIAQMALSLVVGILSARYLGPSNYGLISYGTAYVDFFMALCTLGIDSIIIKDFIDNPNNQGEAIGSTIVLRVISSFLSAALIISISTILDKSEPITIIVVALCSVSLVFHALDTFSFWFQSQYRSKIIAIATFVAYFLTSCYKIILLIYQKDVTWFAFATSVDYIAFGLILLFIYKKNNGPKLSFSVIKSKELLKSSYHFILSGMMVAIYMQTDKLMLKQMLDETSVGYYSTATGLSTMWAFVLSAIIKAMNPTVMRLHNISKHDYERKNIQLYAIVFYLSMFVSVGFLLFGDFIINILYGKEYLPAGMPLKIISWYTAFSYLGVAKNAWMVCENMQKYLKYLSFGSALVNVILNLILIPIWGASGAAVASLITQICACVVLPMLIKDLRPNVILILKAIALKDVLPEK